MGPPLRRGVLRAFLRAATSARLRLGGAKIRFFVPTPHSHGRNWVIATAVLASGALLVQRQKISSAVCDPCFSPPALNRNVSMHAFWMQRHTLHVSVICDPRAAGSRKLGGPLMTLRRRVVTHRQVIPTILDRSGNGPLGSRKVRDFRNHRWYCRNPFICRSKTSDGSG